MLLFVLGTCAALYVTVIMKYPKICRKLLEKRQASEDTKEMVLQDEGSKERGHHIITDEPFGSPCAPLP